MDEEIVNGILDFCYANFDKMNPQKRVEQLSKFFRQVIAPPFLKRNASVFVNDGEIEWESFKKSQQTWREWFEWYVEIFQEKTNLQAGVRATWILDYSESKISLFPMVYDADFIDVAPQNSTKQIPNPPGLVQFLKAIDGLPKNSFLRCQRCSKVFFNPSKRKQVWCSARCRSAEGVRRSRTKKET